MRNPAWLFAAAVVATFALAASGCGGGGGDEGGGASTVPTVTAAVRHHQPSAPTRSGPSREGTTSTPAAPSNHPSVSATTQRRLAPFRDCLSRRGVDLAQLFAGAQSGQPRNPGQFRSQVRAAAACIPELPPRLRKGAEKLRRRFERRFG